MMEESSPESQDTADYRAYAGKWVALDRGKVIGHGGTPEQARRAAQSSQYKEKIEIRFIPFLRDLKFPPIFNKLCEVVADQPEVYLVGGCIRNTLFGLPTHDLDLIVPQHTLQTARKVAKEFDAQLYVMDPERNTVRLILSAEGDPFYLDFAEMRGNSLEDDLRRRDFTLNAIAICLQRPDEVLDPLGGVEDLNQRLIRICAPDAILRDPLRILRGVRLAAQYNLRIHPDTREAMKQGGTLLDCVSAERKRDELLKMLGEHRAATAIRALEWLGVLPQLLPECTTLHHLEQTSPKITDLWEHSLTAIQKLDSLIEVLCVPFRSESASDFWLGLASIQLGRYREQLQAHFAAGFQNGHTRRSLLALALLYHDCGKPGTREIQGDGQVRFDQHERLGIEMLAARAVSLALSREETDYLMKLVKNQARIHQMATFPSTVMPKTIYHYYRDLGATGIDLILFSLADFLAASGAAIDRDLWEKELAVCRSLLDAWWVEREKWVDPPRLIDGNELMERYHLPQGEKIGRVLEAVREAQVAGEIKTRADLPAFLEKWQNEP